MKRIRFIILLLTLLGYSTSFAQLNKKELKIFKEKFFEAGEFMLSGNYAKALPLYVEIERMDPNNAHINWKIGVCYLHSSMDKSKAISYLEIASKSASAAYEEDAHEEKNAPLNVYEDLGHAYHLNYQLDTAVAMYKKFKSFINEKEKDILTNIDRQIKMCRKAQELIKTPVNAIITNLGSKVNSEKSDFGPVVSADESTLIFTSRRKDSTNSKVDEDGKYYEDIYISTKQAGEWSEAVLIDTNINGVEHEATIGLSVDGQVLFIYRDDKGDGNIYSSRLMGESWSIPTLLGSDINTKAWETHAVVNAEGNIIYFVSDRNGGFGGRDIYKSVKLPDGAWSLAANLGPTINTPFDEDAPFIHPDGIQLLFSSDGHQTMGGFDIFSSELSEENKWSKPQNIGYPINTTDDDIFYMTSVDGKRAYYSSTKSGGFGEKDIYMISLPEAEEKHLTVLSGYVTDQYGHVPEYAEVIVTDDNTGEVLGVYNPNASTGKYLIILPEDGNYSITYESDANVYHTEKLYIPPNSAYIEIERAVTLATIKVGEKITLDNIFFEYGKAIIKEESHTAIDKLVAFLGTNIKLQIEISGHTDSKGSDEINMKMSLMRAQALVDALVERGVITDRITAKGYGETQPIADNYFKDGKENKDGMEKNRRVEFKILSIGE
ncbi:MAG: hypothetical protein COB85_04415 [Bacteroidetes bacterium]|nr:MAG: hypothetical protein COB85_04415 [Bacteroidota bacterium]